ncbi:hypothetical protein [Haloferula sp.]|uniref:hypothetical protein n=1 Tax=Haloferula sp. TaxID=2497595 RepID=UPI003C72EF5C
MNPQSNIAVKTNHSSVHSASIEPERQNDELDRFSEYIEREWEADQTLPTEQESQLYWRCFFLELEKISTRACR